MSDVTKTCAICKAPLDADGDCPRAPGFRQPAGSDQIRDKCSHGIYLGTYECTECTGPMSRAELDLIRRWLAGHEKCWPKCDRAPSGEVARLLATIDYLARASWHGPIIGQADAAEEAARVARARCFPGTVIPGHEPLPIPPGLGITAEFLGNYGQIAATSEYTYPFLDALCRLWLARRGHGATD